MARRVRSSKVVEPVPVKTESRICFGIAYFKTEAEADEAARQVRQRGETYNGGFFHGMSCGRDSSFDHVDETYGKVFAVTGQ
jgi:hypothetical protein